MEDVTKIVTISDASSAYNLELGFVPDYVEVRNVTQWAADSKKVYFFWYKDMGDGYYKGMENLGTVATNGQKPIAGTSNGFTAYDSSSFAARQVLIDSTSGITQATNAAVTCGANHGLSTGDRVSFQSIDLGMTEINGLYTTVTVTGATTFTCDDIDSTGFTAWDTDEAGGMIIKSSALVQDAGKKGITLGTDILATNSDVLIVRAVQNGTYGQVTQA